LNNGGRPLCIVRHGATGIITEDVEISNIYIDTTSVLDGIYISNVANLLLENFIIKNTFTGTCGIAVYGSSATSPTVTRVKIKNGIVANCPGGVQVTNINDVTIESLTCYGSSDTYGKVSIQGFSNAFLSNIHSYNNTSNGIFVRSNEGFNSSSLVIQNCQSHDNGGSGIKVAELTGTITDVIISNCICLNNSAYGIRVENVADYIVFLNIALGNTSGQISTSGGDGISDHNIVS